MSRAPWVVLKPSRHSRAGNETLYSTTLGWRMVNPKHARAVDDLARREHGDARREMHGITPRGAGRVRAAQPPAGGQRVGRGAIRRGGRPCGRHRPDRDECIRADTSLEKLAKLRAGVLEGGTVTAGNSSPLNDGAAAVLLGDARRARTRRPRSAGAHRRAGSSRRWTPTSSASGRSQAANAALARAGIGLEGPRRRRAERGLRGAVACLPARVA